MAGTPVVFLDGDLVAYNEVDLELLRFPCLQRETPSTLERLRNTGGTNRPDAVILITFP
jgi:hypothetical protein